MNCTFTGSEADPLLYINGAGMRIEQNEFAWNDWPAVLFVCLFVCPYMCCVKSEGFVCVYISLCGHSFGCACRGVFHTQKLRIFVGSMILCGCALGVVFVLFYKCRCFFSTMFTNIENRSAVTTVPCCQSLSFFSYISHSGKLGLVCKATGTFFGICGM